MITPEQIRAARALLDWSQTDLAKIAGLSQTAIARIETNAGKPHSTTLRKIETALKSSGINFIRGGVVNVGPYCEYCGRGSGHSV